MPKRTLEEQRLAVHQRLNGANWYVSTIVDDSQVEGSQIVVYVRSLAAARQFGTASYDNIPIKYVEVSARDGRAGD